MSLAIKIFEELFTGLSPRQKEVISSRFGIDGGDGKTLASIGEKMNLTRERVRQIENSSLGLMKSAWKKSRAADQLVASIEKELRNAGGALKKDELLKKLAAKASGLTENHLDLLSEATGNFQVYEEDEAFGAFYYLNKEDLRDIKDFVNGWINYLSHNKDKVVAGGYEECLKDFLKAKKFEKSAAENLFGLSKLIHENPYGNVGLAAWPEIKPATTRDRAYLVLKKSNRPMHFEELSKEINKAGLSAQLALAPTVHNELIKDNRFVLVGRGTYALREHGYEPGIAREVIQKVLKKHGPLNPKEVVRRVGKQRLFKPNTILINLQNKTYFERLSDGRYRVHEV